MSVPCVPCVPCLLHIAVVGLMLLSPFVSVCLCSSVFVLAFFFFRLGFVSLQQQVAPPVFGSAGPVLTKGLDLDDFFSGE